jgi:PKD-like domain/CHU_C Type IX secretion signal domain
MKCGFGVMLLLVSLQAFPQMQTCPVNINFASGDLTHWFGYTGNNRDGNGPGAIKEQYDSNTNAPLGTRGAVTIQEYGLPSVNGVQVINYNGTDPFGDFPIIPTINGYNYRYSIKLGSTAITRTGGNSAGGGYIRGVSYNINVPPGPLTEPYTMTYAYAMILENGTHVSKQQPLISVTLRTPDGIILCASPSYLLPTFGNVTEGGRGATLDSATAIKNGFRVSNMRSPNQAPDVNANGGVLYLQDVWVKGWTEVTYDLSPYRGQQVSLTFEADNCVPGGHFAYGYIAIRNSCAGLEISGDSLVCNNSVITYSVPTLAGAVYSWNIPASWTVLSGDTSSIIRLRSSGTPGTISVRETNSCADLKDTIQVNTLPSPVAGDLNGSSTVCAGINSSTLDLVNYSGSIVRWMGSTDGVNWSVIPNNTPQLTVNNLNATTYYRVMVGKGDVCSPDTSGPAIVSVDSKSVGGQLGPPESTICSGQPFGVTISDSGNNGVVLNWQISPDGNAWSDVVPADTTNTRTITGIGANTYYRLINQNGVCPPDTSSVAVVLFTPSVFPQVTIYPADTTICYGTSALLTANVQVGSSYVWNPLTAGAGNISGTPYNLVNSVAPTSTTDFILEIVSPGCPNPLLDTFHVEVLAPVIVDAGRDTSIVVGEPLQFHAVSSDPGPDRFSWSPSSELSDPGIADPVASYTSFDNTIHYAVVATTPNGCIGEGFITVKVFKTKPDIFVPNAFTPGTAINSIFRPIPVGIVSLDYFRIYNRLGQMVYSTSAIGSGWDGNLDGMPQSSGGYVWMVKGTDFTGNIIVKKGVMVLIR